MIDEKKLIERLKEYQDKLDTDMWAKESGNWYGHYCNGMSEGIDDAIVTIYQLAEEHKGGWIPCSERLPDTEDYVLVNGTGNYEGVLIAYYEQEAEKWRYDTDEGIYYYIDVIAWQPLPESYQPPAAVQKNT